MSTRVGPFPGDGAAWNAFAVAQEGFTAFHRAELLDVIESVFGHRCHRLAAIGADGRVSAVLPLVRVRSPIFGHFLISMPFVSYGGPLGSSEGIAGLGAHARALAADTGVGLLELRSATPLPLDWSVSHRKITVVLPLVAGDPSATFNSLKSKLRSQVRRPEKAGVAVRFGPDQVDAFYAVFARHMRDLGTPVMPREWFHALARAYGEDFWVGCAYLGEEPIACGAGFRWNREFEITWASALRAHSAISPNMALYWAFIARAAEAGLERFNFGRCTAGSATHRFKSQWGAVDEPLYWYQGDDSVDAATPTASSGAFGLASRVWQHLPLPVASALGPRIVRYIP